MARPQSALAGSSLPDEEREICIRFREIRGMAGMKQEPFARSLGIPLARLQNFELGRAPIRFPVAMKLCEVFNVNQRWLCSGKLPLRNYFPVAPEVIRLIPDRMLFSEVFNRYLEPLIESELQRVSIAEDTKVGDLDKIPWTYSGPQIGASENTKRSHFIASKIVPLVQGFSSEIPTAILDAFHDELSVFLESFKTRHREAFDLRRTEYFQNPSTGFDEARIRKDVAEKLCLSVEDLPPPEVEEITHTNANGSTSKMFLVPQGSGFLETPENSAKQALIYFETAKECRKNGEMEEAKLADEGFFQALEKGGKIARERFEEFQRNLAKSGNVYGVKTLKTVNALTYPTILTYSGDRNETLDLHPMQNTDISKRLKSARESLGLSQSEAASKWGIRLQTLQQWEHGRREPRGLYKERIEKILAAAESKKSE